MWFCKVNGYCYWELVVCWKFCFLCVFDWYIDIIKKIGRGICKVCKVY